MGPFRHVVCTLSFHHCECTFETRHVVGGNLGAKFSWFSWTISFLHILCVLVTSIFCILEISCNFDIDEIEANLSESNFLPASCLAGYTESQGLRKFLYLTLLSCRRCQSCPSMCSARPQGCTCCGPTSYFLRAIILRIASADLLGLLLVGKGLAGKGTFPGCEWGSGLISRNTLGVPFPKPIISNIIMCRKNSPTLEQDAQKGPQVFLPPLQHAGYPPPKQSPIPSAWSSRQASWTATTRATTSFVDSILVGWMWEESSR